MDKKHCSGCYNDIYNGKMAKECGHLKGAKIVSRVRVGNFEQPSSYKGRKSVRVPDCYRTGSCGDHFVDPKYAR